MLLHQRQELRIPQNLLVLKLLDDIRQMHTLHRNQRSYVVRGGQHGHNRRTARSRFARCTGGIGVREADLSTLR